MAIKLSPSLNENIEVPSHIGIIMDGNGRWAKAKGLPRISGHRQGASAIREIVEAAIEIGVKYLTLYAFSSENWKRPKSEVRELMSLLKYYLGNETKALIDAGVRLKTLGNLDSLDSSIVKEINNIVNLTKNNSKINLIVAINYGSRQEITSAVRLIADLAVKGNINPSEINEESITMHLGTQNIPDPDLIIRTSGEHRLSNFLLWQSAYSELVFLPKLWPDFNREDFLEAVTEYYRRDRRFGGTHS
tara:strand:+ start:380 stop:1120 length:741 start_codon:yes stop_codon:yes gene_type:complete